MFQIVYNDKLSINDIIRMKEEGASFIRSAHIGNWNKQTLILSKLGIPILLHEHLHGDAKVYEPSYLKRRGEKIRISNNEDDSTLQIYDNAFIYSQKYGYTKPSTYHYYALKKVSDNIENISQYFLKRENFLKEVLISLMPRFPSGLYKYVDSSGKEYLFDKILENGDFFYKCNEDIKTISKDEILNEIFKMLNGVNTSLTTKNADNPSGIIMDSKYYLFLTCMCELYDRSDNFEQTTDLYHFSGTQMINYLIKNKKMAQENNDFLEEAYRIVCERFEGIFPENITFNLIPTDCLQLIGCLKSQKCDQLDEFYRLGNRIEELRKNRLNIISQYIQEVYKRVSKLESKQLEKIVIHLQNHTDHRRRYKLKKLYQNKDRNRTDLISEVSNVISKRNPDLSCKVETVQHNIDRNEHDREGIVCDNLDLFFSDFSQYDLLFDQDDVYISDECRNLSLGKIRKIGKMINRVKSQSIGMKKHKKSEKFER